MYVYASLWYTHYIYIYVYIAIIYTHMYVYFIGMYIYRGVCVCVCIAINKKWIWHIKRLLDSRLGNERQIIWFSNYILCEKRNLRRLNNCKSHGLWSTFSQGSTSTWLTTGIAENIEFLDCGKLQASREQSSMWS